MDPTENLRKQLVLANKLVAEYHSRTTAVSQEEEDAYWLAEHVIALDEWISRGGFLPARWQPLDPAKII